MVPHINHMASVCLLEFLSFREELEGLRFAKESMEEQNVLIRVSFNDFYVQLACRTRKQQRSNYCTLCRLHMY